MHSAQIKWSYAALRPFAVLSHVFSVLLLKFLCQSANFSIFSPLLYF